MQTKLTIRDLFKAQDEGRQLSEVFASDPLDAIASEEAGIDILVCMSSNLKSFRALAPHVFIVAADGINNPDVAHPNAAVSAAFRDLQDGADAIYTGLSLECVRTMAREKVPVIGHVGYIPYRNSWSGGPRAIGKTSDEAEQVYRDTMAFQEAGAIGVEMEIVPERVAAEIAKRTDLLLFSMGSGTSGLCQYLFCEDVLGSNGGHVPRHAKVYADLKTELERLHRLRVDALSEFKREVSDGIYPAASHLLPIADEEFNAFLAAIERE